MNSSMQATLVIISLVLGSFLYYGLILILDKNVDLIYFIFTNELYPDSEIEKIHGLGRFGIIFFFIYCPVYFLTIGIYNIIKNNITLKK